MTKEVTFEHPPGKHVGLLAYDAVNDRWQVVYVGDDGRLHTDVKASALPTGAATAANQATAITALQAIDDLRNALGSVATDDLQVDVKESALPSGAATETTLSSIGTELASKLETADLSIGAQTKYLDVVAKSVPDSGAQLYGWDDDEWVKVQTAGEPGPALKVVIGHGGNIIHIGKVNSDAVSAETKSQYAATLLYGFNGTTWDRLRCENNILNVNVKTLRPASGEKLFGLSVRISNAVSNTNLAAGSNSLAHAAVPANEVWVITNITQLYTGTAPSLQSIDAVVAGTGLAIATRAGAARPNGFTWTGNLVLQEGDYVAHYVEDATAGDDLYGYYVGYKMTAP